MNQAEDGDAVGRLGDKYGRRKVWKVRWAYGCFVDEPTEKWFGIHRCPSLGKRDMVLSRRCDNALLSPS